MSKVAVLCVTRSALAPQFNPTTESGIHPFNFKLINPEDLHYINRTICDSKDSQVIEAHASHFPQVLPYVMFRSDNRVLIYSRSKGAETRLHGTLSLGFGGHCDLNDYDATHENPFENAVLSAFDREMMEELKYNSDHVEITQFDQAIVDMTNPVGSVHLGLFTEIYIQSPSDVRPNPDEIASPEWVEVDWLKANKDRFENWSRMIIEELL